MTYEEALADMCKDCCLHPCKALKNKDRCYSYNILNKALEKADKYRWHDLRKNPDDLPPHGMKVECQHLPNLITDAEELVVFHYFINGNFVYNWDLDTDVRSKTFGQRIYGDIIAWREIEPFEVTE